MTTQVNESILSFSPYHTPKRINSTPIYLQHDSNPQLINGGGADQPLEQASILFCYWPNKIDKIISQQHDSSLAQPVSSSPNRKSISAPIDNQIGDYQ